MHQPDRPPFVGDAQPEVVQVPRLIAPVATAGVFMLEAKSGPLAPWTRSAVAGQEQRPLLVADEQFHLRADLKIDHLPYATSTRRPTRKGRSIWRGKVNPRVSPPGRMTIRCEFPSRCTSAICPRTASVEVGEGGTSLAVSTPSTWSRNGPSGSRSQGAVSCAPQAVSKSKISQARDRA